MCKPTKQEGYGTCETIKIFAVVVLLFNKIACPRFLVLVGPVQSTNQAVTYTNVNFKPFGKVYFRFGLWDENKAIIPSIAVTVMTVIIGLFRSPQPSLALAPKWIALYDW